MARLRGRRHGDGTGAGANSERNREQSNIFFKLMEERYRQHSTIITTNLVYDEWPNFLGSRPMVEALLSRLRHYCHTVTIDGPSLRDPQG